MIYKLPSYKLLNATRVLTYKLIIDYISYTKIRKTICQRTKSIINTEKFMIYYHVNNKHRRITKIVWPGYCLTRLGISATFF